MSPASPHHGSETSAARITAASAAKMRLAPVARSTRTVSTAAAISVPRPRKQPAGAQNQDDQKGDMTGEDLPIRIERRADRLGDTEHHAADQRTPHAAEAADDDGFERKNEPDRPGRWIEDRANPEQHARDRGEHHRNAERERV